MGTKYIENTGTDVMYVGGKMIPPGEGRDIDTTWLPAELQDPAAAREAPREASLIDLLGELLGKSVKAITAELPSRTFEALDLLAELEGKASTPRVTLLGAIQAEQLQRAQRLQDEEAQARHAEFVALVDAAYEEALKALTPEELEAIGEDGRAELRRKAEESVQAAASAT